MLSDDDDYDVDDDSDDGPHDDQDDDGDENHNHPLWPDGAVACLPALYLSDISIYPFHSTILGVLDGTSNLF